MADRVHIAETHVADEKPMPAATLATGGLTLRGGIVALFAATLAVLVRGLFEPLLAGNHAFFLTLLAVVFVSWHSGFWPGIVTLLTTALALVYFFIEPKDSFAVESVSDELSVGLYLLAGLACALLGQSQIAHSGRAARNLDIAQAKQLELESLATQLSASQRQTAETLAQLDTFLMNAPLGLALFDRDMRLVRINKRLAEENALNAEEYIGRPLEELVPVLPLEGLTESRRVLETGEPLIDRLLVGRADVPAVAGRVWESSYYPVRETDGNLLGVGVVTREISQKLRDEQALKDSEAQFRSLAESMPQIVWISRPDGSVEYFNPKWYHYTGRNAAESLESEWLTVIHADDRATALENWTQSTATGMVYEVTYRFRGTDGSYRWFLGRGLPQRDDTGKLLRWFGTSTDIDDAKRIEGDLKESRVLLQESHGALEQRVALRTIELSDAISALRDEVEFRRHAEERVLASARELRRSNEELEQFAYVASHDLQEPLRKIQAFGDRLKVKFNPTLGPDGNDYLERMLSSATRMRQLINDLLAYSRLTTKSRAFVPVNLGTIAVGMLSDLEIRIQQSDARIEIGPLPTIDADPLQMRQLFQNLLSNALKFARAGVPPEVTIRCGVAPEDAQLCQLHFADNGIGFDVKYLDRIFQVFQRLHGRGDYEGTGVGLAICHKIVHQHGGQITARSTPGQGAMFTVTLPYRQPAAPQDAHNVANETDHHPHGR